MTSEDSSTVFTTPWTECVAVFADFADVDLLEDFVVWAMARPEVANIPTSINAVSV
jgi:hypothetical protein